MQPKPISELYPSSFGLQPRIGCQNLYLTLSSLSLSSSKSLKNAPKLMLNELQDAPFNVQRFSNTFSNLCYPITLDSKV